MSKPICECDTKGTLREGAEDDYDPITELPYVDHEPGKCRCVNELQVYRRGNKLLTLCSCCRLYGDIGVIPERGNGSQLLP